MGYHGPDWASKGSRAQYFRRIVSSYVSRRCYREDTTKCATMLLTNSILVLFLYHLAECQAACKPGSVHAVFAALNGHSSGARLATCLDATNPGDGARHPCVHPFRDAAGHPYSVLLPVGFTLPPLSPGARCALTAPFHPCLRSRTGGLFSVALSLGSPPPAVSRHRIPVEPGLSSTPDSWGAAAVQPPDLPGVRAAAAGRQADSATAAATAAKRAQVASSAMPLTPACNQWRWNARSNTSCGRSVR